MTTSFRSLIRHLAPYFSARIRRNSRLLSSSSALSESHLSSSESPAPSTDSVHLTNSCVRATFCKHGYYLLVFRLSRMLSRLQSTRLHQMLELRDLLWWASYWSRTSWSSDMMQLKVNM